MAGCANHAEKPAASPRDTCSEHPNGHPAGHRPGRVAATSQHERLDHHSPSGACDTATVTYHESFWIAASAVAPVIALAAVVAMSDAASIMGEARRAEYSMRMSRILAGARLLDEAYRRDLAAAQQDRVAEGEARGAGKWSLIAWLGTLLNLAIQAALLAVSLWALAYHEDVIRPWVAIIPAIGGIVLLACIALVAAEQRYTLQNPLFRKAVG